MWTKSEDLSQVEMKESIEGPSSSTPPLPSSSSSSSSLQIPGVCQDNSSQLINYKKVMLKNQFDLRKKEEEVQEYVEKLTKIKSKVKLSRRSADSSNVEQSDLIFSKKNDHDIDRDAADDGNDDKNIDDENAKTPKAKSHLLQKKLAENRRIFQQRNKELSESKRAVEEKVEEIRLQISDTDLSIEKDKKFIELNDKINELQMTIIDLQDNLKEKDSVIDSKSRAITLMTEDLSKKGKITLDTLEDTKSEMRLMQENFIQLELSFRSKIDHLIHQLEEKEHRLEIVQRENESMNLINTQKDNKITELQDKAQDLMNIIGNKNVERCLNEENEKNMKELQQELEESNKNMIKMKMQHKNKLRNLQKRLENFRTMSDTNAELMKLENQLALLEEEKGNLQLSLVDFDELKASNEELQRRMNELENQTIAQMNEIQMHIEAIAALENQKLDLIQELHGVKQEMSALENENSESENLRVTAELKIVELEEQLEKLHKKKVIGNDSATIIDDSVESEKVGGIDKKSTDSTGSTESFERIMDAGDSGIALLTAEVAAQSDEISQLNEKISYLTDENSELVIALTKIREKISENENWRDKFNELKIENDKLVDNNHRNFIDKQTLMSLESEIVNLKQLHNENHMKNEELINDSAIDREHSQLVIAELNKTISSLESKLIDEQSITKSFEHIIEEKNRLINEFEIERSQNDEKMNYLKANQIKLNQFIEEKMSFYGNLEGELRQTIEKLNIEVKNGEKTINILEEKSSEMQLGLEKKKIFIDECSSDQANQAAAIKRLLADNEKLTLINCELNQEIEHLGNEAATAIKQIENLELEHSECIQEIHENKIAINDFQLKLNNVNEEYSVNIDSLEKKFRSTIVDLEEKNNRMQRSITAIEEKNEFLRKELKQKDQILHEMEAKYHDITENNLAVTTNLDELTLKIDILNATIYQKDEIIMKNVKEVANLEVQLEEEMDKNVKKLFIIEQSNRELDEQRQEIKIQYEEKSNLYEELLIQVENQSKYYEDVKQELSNAYKMMEQLKMKHQEDIVILNQRLESLITDLSDKTKENEELKLVIDRQETTINSNFTHEVKNSLEERILSLERDIEDANNNTQAQLHKMKIIAANLKRKSAQCQELEIKLREIEKNLTIEKERKEDLNGKIHSLNQTREENEEMLKKLELNVHNAQLVIQNVKISHDELMAEYQNYKEKSSLEIMEKDRELMVVKEKARELDVRMQVMEAEYLEQLNTIHRSETEHRLLLSKLSQVNELLENTKIESAELKNQQRYLQAKIDEVEDARAIEVTEKTKMMNDLMIERHKYEIELKELLIKLDERERENKGFINEYQELKRRMELPMVEKDMDVFEIGTSPPQNAVTSEVLFNASICFGTTSDIEMSGDNEILNLKKLLDNQKNEQKILESKNAQMNVELNELKLQISNLIVNNEKNNVTPENDDGHDDKLPEAMKLDEDEEWSWNTKEEEISSNTGQYHLFSSKETQLNARIAELEDSIKDMSDEKLRLNNDLKLIQVKNGKLIRKLKEYKIQSESLQQQLKIQLTSGELCDLDSAIEEELRCQVSRLEKSLHEMKNDNEKITSERDHYSNKIDALMAANERFTDIKERQDRDLEVMYIRNNELMKKIELLEVEADGRIEKLYLQEEKNASITTTDNDNCNKCKELISELQENVELLAMENDELRKLIELEKQKLIEKINEVSENKIQSADELKINFYDMLEKSHNLEKQCIDTLEETNQEKNNLEENYQANLIEASNKILELEENIMQKEMIIKNVAMTIETCQMNLEDKNHKLKEANQKIEEIEINMKNEVATKQMEIRLLNETIENDRINFSVKIKQLEEANKKIEENEVNLKNQMYKKQIEIQMLEATNENSRLNMDKLVDELKAARNQMQNMEIVFNKNIATSEMKINNLENNLGINSDKMNKQTEELLELQRQLKEMRISSEISLKKCQDVGEKCFEELEDTNQESIIVKEAHDLYVTKWNEKTREFEDRIEENCHKLAERDSAIKIIEENLKIALNDGVKWHTDYHEIEKKLVEVNENMATVTELLDVRVQEVADLKQYIQRLEFDKLALENCNVNVDNLNRKLIAKDNEIISITSKYKNQMHEKLEEILNLQKTISALNLERDQSISKLDNQAQGIQILRESINNSETLITTLRTQISSKDKQILQLENKIMSSNNETERLTAVIGELETSIILTRSDLNEKITELNEKTREVTKLQAELTELISIRQHESDEHKMIEKQFEGQLSAKSDEIEDLKYILNESTYPTMIQQLQNKIDKLYEEKSQLEQSLLPNLKNLSERQSRNVKIAEQNEIGHENSNELDVALYMLHQRDVKCEELTHELMQLLEERDSLQLRLSNAIRVNEEYRKLTVSVASLKRFEQVGDDGDAITENRVSIIDDSDTQPTLTTLRSADSDEETMLLTKKLSQLRNVGHRKDIRLLDERELRNTQQMSLIAHKDALSTLPPDAAARLINANYTLSRDVQSQSSVLLNWLWGKSTPKVVHM